MTPASTTSAPSAARPAASADSSMGPDRRVSRASTKGRSAPRTRAAARPSANASSGVSSTLARPRTPSVPKRSIRERGLALRVLRRLAGLLEAVLLALSGPGVPSEEACLLDRRPQIGVEGHEGPGNTEPHGPRLPAHPAARQRAIDVVDLGGLRQAQRLGHDHAVGGVGEEILERALVAEDHPGTGA